MVRSLYYDDPDYSAYADKVEGVFNRDKFRIRTYEPTREEATSIKVEVKTREGYIIYKAAKTIGIEDYLIFLKDRHWGHASGYALEVFSYNLHKFQLRPTVIVQYCREAYYGLIDGGVRFSFDHNVQYAWGSDLFMPEYEFKTDLANSVVFEVKVLNNDIRWVNELIQQMGLVSAPNSKYANAFEHTVQDIWV